MTAGVAAAADEPDRVGELAAVGGVLYPRGAFIEERICDLRRSSRFFGCLHVLYGEQVGTTGELVFDLYATEGVSWRRGRFDITALVGASVLSTMYYAGEWILAIPLEEVPDAKKSFATFPFEVTGSVALGYSILKIGRLRVRAEVGIRGHLPVFTDSRIERPSPRGIGFTVGLGIAYRGRSTMIV